MIQYIYFVKCPECEDEHFDFFNDAKDYALGCLSKKPIITQTEVCRNDFGECTDSSDLGTIWSWEDEACVEDDAAINVFTKGDFAEYNPDNDTEFDVIDNSVDFDIDDIPDNFSMPVTEDTVNKFVIVGESEDYKKQFYSADSDTWVAKVEDATIYTDRNDAIVTLSDLDTSEFYTVKVMIKPTAVAECADRKPIPEGMTIEQLVEEMEENEDTVECSWCEELFDKSECRYEVNLGWLCSRCEAAIKSRGETLTFRENNYWDFLDEDKPLKEATSSGEEMVELYYDSLTTTVYGNQRDADDWDEEEYTSDYSYMVSKDDIAITIWENFITEEDVQDVPGGLEALEDDDTWNKFLETHFDTLFDKYYDKLLKHYEYDANEAFSNGTSWEDYQDAERGNRADYEYDSWRDSQFDESVKTNSVSEELEDSADYNKRLDLCPECGQNKFDSEAGLCINCGFNIF